MVAFLVYFRFHGAAWLARKIEASLVARRLARETCSRLLEGFSDGLRGIRTLGDLAALVGYTALHWFLVACCYLLIVHAFGGSSPRSRFANVILVLAFSLFGSAIQFPGVGGGAQIATFLALTVISAWNPGRQPSLRSSSG